MATNSVPMRELQKQGHKPRPCNPIFTVQTCSASAPFVHSFHDF
jgi:hypothetical protein